MSRIRSCGCLAALVLLLAPQAASAHATLEGTTPSRGAVLQKDPKRVTFRFSEPVEVVFGSLRVYDQQGRRVDEGGTTHVDGQADTIAVAVRGGLQDGTYTATYRVISADSHPVAGGYTFSVGAAGTPTTSLDELIDAPGAGPVTDVGFGIVRVLSYLALALAVGGVAFIAAVWAPTLRARGGATDDWRQASEAFAVRARTLILGAVAIGVAMSALGIVFQGAVAGGTSVWAAVDGGVVRDVLDTRFGTVWVLRLLAWMAVGALLVLPMARLRAPELRPASLGATGLAPSPAASRFGAAALAAMLAILCVTPALAGHASTLADAWLLVPANVLHVMAMSVWIGGIAMLLLALPAATRRLDPGERTGLLAMSVARFSTLALAAVAVLVASGTIQAIAEVEALSDLVDTPFGRAILIKIGLLCVLIALGAVNRQRIRPRLTALDAAGAAPGGAGVELRRSLRAEAMLMAAVLAVTAALVSYAPASSSVTGPFSTSAKVGPARLELTVDPARAGSNQIHLYLIDRHSGRQYDRPKELTISASLPEKHIGPLRLDAQKAGPGHYVVRRAALAPTGTWGLEINARVSKFDAYVTRVEVPIK